MPKRKRSTQWAARPSKAQERLIRALGGQTAVAAIIKERLKLTIRPEAVSMWIRRGIPYRYRAALALEAGKRGVSVPPGFLGEGTVNG